MTIDFSKLTSIDDYISQLSSQQMAVRKEKGSYPAQEGKEQEVAIIDEEIEKDNPQFMLIEMLGNFTYRANYKSARELWLLFTELNMAPAREVMEVFYQQLKSDHDIWSKPEDNRLRRLCHHPIHEVYDKYYDTVAEYLRGKGYKVTKTSVMSEMISSLSEYHNSYRKLDQQVIKSRENNGKLDSRLDSIGFRLERSLEDRFGEL